MMEAPKQNYHLPRGTIGGSEHESPKSGSRAIPQALSNLDKDLYTLGELVNELNNRLKPVSNPESPQTIATNEQPKAEVPIAFVISNASMMLCAQIQHLKDIIERLEV